MTNPIPKDLLSRIKASGASVTGSREIDHATQYTLTRGPETATLNVYRTKKVLEGGKASGLRDLLRDWRLSRSAPAAGASTGTDRSTAGSVRGLAAPGPNGTPRVGTDEAGKGEYLGPLVVAGVRVIGAEKDLEIRELGARDSKALGLRQARALAEGIKGSLGPENLRVVSLPPREYEARRDAAGGNVNRLLGELNAGIIGELGSEVEVVVVDAFGKKAGDYIREHLPGAGSLRLEVRPRAEDDAAVAAASILARARYLEEMDALSELVGFELPRGSTHVLEAARRVVRERGEEGLADVAKVHFATTRQVLEETNDNDGGGR